MKRDMLRKHEEAGRQCAMCKLFASPARIMLLEELAGGEKTVSMLVKSTGLSQSNISQHIALMRSQEILASRRDGKMVHYCLKYPELEDAFRIMKKVMRKRIKR